MKVVVITQARLGSTRLPKKISKKILGKTLLQIHIDRIKKAKLVDEIIIATTVNKEDDEIVELAKKFDVKYSRGSQNDVLDRFYQSAKGMNPDYIVRLTSDCPLIDPFLIDEVIKSALKKKVDYYANVLEERYPDGQDIEVFAYKSLEKAWNEAKLLSEREHVTSYIRNNSSYKGGNMFTSDNHNIQNNYNHVRLTVDEEQDYQVVKMLIEALGFENDWKTYTDYYLNSTDVCSLNNAIKRNEGYYKSLEKDN